MNILAAHRTLSGQLEALIKSKYTLHEIAPLDLGRYESFSQYDLVFVEAKEFRLQDIPITFSPDLSRFVFVGDPEDEEVGELIRSAGFVRFISPGEMASLIRHYKNGIPCVQDNLKILLFDENSLHQSIIRQIAGDFYHSVTIVEDFDAFYSALGTYYDIIFINIHTKACDMALLSRKVYGVSNFKRACVLPFLEQAHCEIADIYNGLNRIARVVLNMDELIHFLINLCYKREIEAHRMLINRDMLEVTGEKISYIEKPSVAYGEFGEDFVMSYPEIDRSKLCTIAERSRAILAINAVVAPYLWLMHDHDGPTCGQGVYK